MIMTQKLDKFGMLTVIKRVENVKGHIMLLCKCDCGNEKVVRKSHLLNGEVISCGCHKRDICKSFGDTRKLNNEYEIYNDYAVGKDKRGNSFKVSLCDLEIVKKYYWFSSHGYFVSEKNGARIQMHRLIIQTDKVVDHINGDRGDNRRENLRECTEAENALNKGVSNKNISGYPGVYYHKVNKNWIAYINYKKKRISLGSFETKNEAIEARKKAEKKYYGDFARKNTVDNHTEGKY